MTIELHMLFIIGPKFDHCLALSVAHSQALLNFVQIVEFVKVGKWISLLGINGLVKIYTWISLSFNTDLSKLIHGFLYVVKCISNLIHGFLLAVTTWIC